MVVVAIGVIMDGLPVIQVDFKQADSENRPDQSLRNGLIAAIQTFARDAFSDDIDELHFKNLTVCLKTAIVLSQSMTLYAVADRNTRTMNSVRNTLAKVAQKLIEGQRFLDPLDQKKNQGFESYFTKEFINLTKDSSFRGMLEQKRSSRQLEH